MIEGLTPPGRGRRSSSSASRSGRTPSASSGGSACSCSRRALFERPHGARAARAVLPPLRRAADGRADRRLLEHASASTAKARALARELSGGQQQRLAIALALVHEPEIVFLDEPTTGLDPQARRKLWDVIRAIGAEGRTVVLTTHYLEEAEELCDRVAIMDGGRIVALDSPRALIRALGPSSRVDLRRATGSTRRRLAAAAGVTSVASVEDGALRARLERRRSATLVGAARAGRCERHVELRDLRRAAALARGRLPAADRPGVPRVSAAACPPIYAFRGQREDARPRPHRALLLAGLPDRLHGALRPDLRQRRARAGPTSTSSATARSCTALRRRRRVKLHVAADERTALKRVHDGDATAALIVDGRRGAPLLPGLVDGAGPILRAIVQGVARQAEHPRVAAVQPLVARDVVEHRATVSLSYIDYLVPGLLAMAISQSAVFGDRVRARRVPRSKGIFRRLRADAACRSASSLAARVLMQLCLALVQAVVLLAVGHFAFGVAFVGQPALAGPARRRSARSASSRSACWSAPSRRPRTRRPRWPTS